MGGLLIREYLQSRNSAIPYKNDIHKFISLNTPHYGTQVANYLLKPENLILRAILKLLRNYDTDKGAVEDLKFDSYEIKTHINIPQNSQINKVPSATIFTEDDLNSTDPDGYFVSRILNNAITKKHIFNDELNDIIVPVSSQRAGILSLPIENQWHVGSSRNNQIIDKVELLLNKPVSNSTFFSTNGFIPSELIMPDYRAPVQTRTESTDNISITNIINNQTFSSGDSIEVHINSTGNINRILFVAGNNNIHPFTKDTLAGSNIVKFQIPVNAIGKLSLCAVGFDTIDILDVDTLNINITTSASLDSIKCQQSNLSMPVCYNKKINIHGYYNDNSIREITSLPGIELSPNNTNIQLNGSLITAIDSGTTIINVNYLNKSTSIRVNSFLDTSLLNANLASNKIEICPMETVNFYNQSTGSPISVEWKFPGGNPLTSSEINPIIQYSQPGKYTVTLISNYFGKTDSIKFENYITVKERYKTKKSGHFDNPLTWSCNSIPTQGDSVIVSSWDTLYINQTGAISKIYIEPNGSVTLNDSTILFKIGADTNKISQVICDGALTIKKGTLHINGNLSVLNSGSFEMTGGKLIIDGNTGQPQSSIPDGQHLFNIAPNVSKFNFKNGTLQFINPPLGENSQTINCPFNFGLLSTVAFGDGVSTTPTTNPHGFGGDLLPSALGKIIFDPATYNGNRIFKNVNSLTANKEIKVLSGNFTTGLLFQAIDSTPTLTDVDNNHYPIIDICGNDWLTKNLEVTHYRNGDTIPQVQDPAIWAGLTTGAWCYYLNNTANGPVYGKLYNWYAVNDPRGLAPLGWHIPSHAEWDSLTNTCLGGATSAGAKMKTIGTLQAGTGLWGGVTNNSTNSSGFSGLPSGCRLPTGVFTSLSASAFWWSNTSASSTNAWFRETDQDDDNIYTGSNNKKLGLSVRCIRD